MNSYSVSLNKSLCGLSGNHSEELKALLGGSNKSMVSGGSCLLMFADVLWCSRAVSLCGFVGGGCELLHQTGGQTERGVQEGEGEGQHQTAGHGVRHLPERGHDGNVSVRRETKQIALATNIV